MVVGHRWLRDLVARFDPTIGAVALVPLVVVWVFLYRGTDCDLDIYYRYAQTGRAGSLERVYAAHDIEYPPLAVLLFLGTDAVARALPDCSPLGALSGKYQATDPSLNFRVAYRLEMALVAFAVLGGLLVLLRGWQVGDNRLDRCERVLTFILGLALLSRVAFDRLDLLLSALVLLALGVLTRSRRPAWSLLVLALAVVFKVVPIALAPIWVIGSVPLAVLANREAPGGWRRLLLSVTGRGLSLAGLVLLIFLPFYLLVGSRALVFFTYHKDRGIEIESTYAAVLGTLKHATGHELAVESGHGGCDLVSTLTPALTQMAPFVLGVLLLGAMGLFLTTLLRTVPAQPPAVGTPTQLAAAHHDLFTGFLIVFVLVFLLANKVFSPQFVLWLLPLVPLVPLARRPRRFFQAGFLGVCLVTHFIYPRYLEKSLYGQVPGSSVCGGPTLFGAFLLDTRTLLLLALLVGLTAQMVRRVRCVSGATRGAENRRVPVAWPSLSVRRSA
ncbi:hypothetical protein [Frigoriglobus tundricola]|uniref:DUF2029 domain-containing protein n=1 Tax=Frigoriglobus tundricola TaxID=2774151 RepID=A0A6M5YN03_9BACT|nr:hypothetical protein [Frigoriglobus tundricola]QJW95308.1 hypothetical protein FTUN_2855 [Frigoriglobus tundricola]